MELAPSVEGKETVRLLCKSLKTFRQEDDLELLSLRLSQLHRPLELLYDKDHELQLDDNYNISQYEEAGKGTPTDEKAQAKEEPETVVSADEIPSRAPEEAVEEEEELRPSLGQSGRRFLTEATKLIPIEPDDEQLLQQREQEQGQQQQQEERERERERESTEEEERQAKAIAQEPAQIESERREEKQEQVEEQSVAEPSKADLEEFEQMVSDLKQEIEADEESGYGLLEEMYNEVEHDNPERKLGKTLEDINDEVERTLEILDQETSYQVNQLQQYAANEKYTCRKCGQGFLTLVITRKHELKCTVGNETLDVKDADALPPSVASHENNNMYECNICHKKFHQQYEVIKHVGICIELSDIKHRPGVLYLSPNQQPISFYGVSPRVPQPPRPPAQRRQKKEEEEDTTPREPLLLSFGINPSIQSVMSAFTATALSSWDPKMVHSVEKVMNPSILARFMKRWRYFKTIYLYDSEKCKPVLVYHGTRSHNVEGIKSKGLLVGGRGVTRTTGNLYGTGIYCSPNPETAKSYTGGYGGTECCVFVCAALLGRKNVRGRNRWPVYYDSNVDGDIYVIYNPSQILPLYVIKYNRVVQDEEYY